jgi:hypothetical protein
MIADPRLRWLLILACSATKHHDPDPIPARDRSPAPCGSRCAPRTHKRGLHALASSPRGSVSVTRRRLSTTTTHASARISPRE